MDILRQHNPIIGPAQINATILSEDITVGDLKNWKQWVLVDKVTGKPITWWDTEEEREYKWTTSAKRLPIENMRLGGEYSSLLDRNEKPVLTPGFLTWRKVLKLREDKTKDNSTEPIVYDNGYKSASISDSIPAIAFYGTNHSPCPMDIGIIDVDYTPEDDINNKGKRWVDRLHYHLVGMKMPRFKSKSGNGFHALFRITNLIEWNSTGIEIFPKHPINGTQIEIFISGSSRVTTLRLNNPIKNYYSNIPRITRYEILDAICKSHKGNTYKIPILDIM